MPLDLASPDLAERMMEIGHSPRCAAVRLHFAKESPRLERNWLVIEQNLGDNWSEGRRCPAGDRREWRGPIDTNATGRTKRSNSFDLADIMTVRSRAWRLCWRRAFDSHRRCMTIRTPTSVISGFTGMASFPEWETAAWCAIPSASSIVTE